MSEQDRKAAEDVSLEYAEKRFPNDPVKIYIAATSHSDGRSRALKKQNHTEYTIGYSDGKKAGTEQGKKELEQIARDAWEAAIDAYEHYMNYGDRASFECYWQKKTESKEGEGEQR